MARENMRCRRRSRQEDQRAGRHRSLRRAAASLGLAVVGLASADLALGADETSFIPTGTWFVVAHYQDSATANPEETRWEDRVWVFETKGSRLQWTEYPIVVFTDATGRFESRGGNARARTLQAWLPNDTQRAELAAGPRVNSRGSKTKSLRGDAAHGWESAGALRAQSATVIGYHETWRIAMEQGLPRFEREDTMGMGRTSRRDGDDQDLSGLTRFAVRERRADGSLAGDYQRDEHRRGRFVMLPVGPVRGLESDGRTPNEKRADEAREAILAAEKERIEKGLAEGDPETIRELRELQRQQQERRP